jgi:enterochelin esterase-like enzyme
LIPVLFLIPGGCAFSDALGHYLAPAEQETPVDPPVVVTSTPLPSPTSTPTEIPCQETAGKVTRITVQAEDPLAPITASVYTPPCYDAETGGYPVLYLLHGQNQTDEYWFDLGAAQVADDAINAGRAPFLIVSPYEEDSFAPVAESDFGSEVVEELIPYIESHYAVCSTRACHAIGGISHGGGWAVHIALVHIDLFSSVGAHSPGYFIGDTSRIVRLRQTLSPDQFPRFYVDRGEKDYLQPEIDALDRTLTNYGITHVYQVSPGSHAESYWRAHVADYLNWYMDGFDSLR